MFRAGWRACATTMLAFGSFLVFVSAAAAATNPYQSSPAAGSGGLSDAYTQCIVKVGQGDRSECIAMEYDRQDVRLNAAYKKVSTSLGAEGSKALREDERHWIAARAQACGGTPATVTKNACALEQTMSRADALEDRLRGGGVSSATDTLVSGEWGYNSDCDTGHFVEFSVTRSMPEVEGTWSDGTRVHGNQGSFKGQLRDGRLYVRFCAEDEERGGYPVCPSYGEVDAYVAREGNNLVWYRVWGARTDNTFRKYVTLSRKPHGGDVPTDTRCPKDAE